MTVYVELQGTLQISNAPREVLEAVFFAMGDVLVELEAHVDSVLDHAVAIDLGQGILDLEVTARGSSYDQADRAAKAAVIFAIVRTGGSLDPRESGILDLVSDRSSVVEPPSVETLNRELESAGVRVRSRELALRT